jgi:hypothetical protein
MVTEAGEELNKMPSPIHVRFSMLTLLLLVTLSCVSVSHWLTSQRLTRMQLEMAEQRRIVRNLNEDLGNLTIDDPDDVHVIATDHVRTADRHGELPLRIGWKLHLPKQTSWQVCWSVGDVPMSGMPRETDGTLALDTGLDSECQIGVSLTHSGSTGWLATVSNGNEEVPYFVPATESRWLNHRLPVVWEAAGDEVSGSVGIVAKTEAFAANRRVILLRCRHAPAGADGVLNDPPPFQGGGFYVAPGVRDNSPFADGLMVWLERRD